MMLGRSTLRKQMKRRSALASDWLEKNQSEVAESSLNGIDPVQNERDEDHGNDSRWGFNGEFDNGNDEDSKIENLPKSNCLNAEKISTNNLKDTDNHTGFQAGSTVDNKSVKKSSLEESETNGNVSTKQATEKNKYSSSNLVVADNIDDNNTDLLSMTGNTINSESARNSCVTKPSSGNNSSLVVSRRRADSQDVGDSSTTKRKRTKAVEASSTSEHLEPCFGGDVEEKPIKKRKTSDDAYGEVNIEPVQNGGTEGKCETEEEGEDERSQSGKSCQADGVKKK